MKVSKMTSIFFVLLSLAFLQSCTTEAPHSLEGMPSGLWVIDTTLVDSAPVVGINVLDSTKEVVFFKNYVKLSKHSKHSLIRSEDQVHWELEDSPYYINYRANSLFLIPKDPKKKDTLSFVHRIHNTPIPYSFESFLSKTATSVWECKVAKEDHYYLFIDETVKEVQERVSQRPSNRNYETSFGYTAIKVDSIDDEYMANFPWWRRHEYEIMLDFSLIENFIFVSLSPHDSPKFEYDYVVTQLDSQNIRLDPIYTTGRYNEPIEMTRVLPISNQVDTILRHYEISKKILEEAGMKY